MKLALPRLTKPALFNWLMAFSCLLVLLPAGGKRWMVGILQPLGLIEWMVSGTARTVREIASDVTESPLTADESEKLRDRVSSLERFIGHLSDENNTLRDEIDRVTGLADQLRDAKARLIIASVHGGSATPRRAEMTIGKGEFAGVKVGDWVASSSVNLRRPTEISGRDLLAREWLIGKVTDVLPYESHVRLLTDVDFGPEKIILARKKPDGTWERAEQVSLLYGDGAEMRIKGVSRNYFDDGFNLVLAPINGLQGSVLIAGEIFASQSRQDTAQRFDLRVRPIGDPSTLSQVYVISLGR